MRWVLLLQELDLWILDRMEAKNQVADHLSRLEIGAEEKVNINISEKFASEQLFQVEYCEVMQLTYRMPCSFGNQYILLAVDYVSKWAEAIAVPANDTKVMVQFLRKNIFSRFRTLRALISDD
ncbi:Retrovirus-related Pol polyprotein from transposon 17.6 [Gossypium australe]|uniref:Retrovirus-related Pol polyprotein from transposon 17.6 n=1 Tax=Gossypium australe TaxID=47621 RepID=A0A5B6VAB5_9ROSI|nr:Retrovirus-related Pol polyprotein from transposon 17.6 [Gossypium australe]